MVGYPCRHALFYFCLPSHQCLGLRKLTVMVNEYRIWQFVASISSLRLAEKLRKEETFIHVPPPPGFVQFGQHMDLQWLLRNRNKPLAGICSNKTIYTLELPFHIPSHGPLQWRYLVNRFLEFSIGLGQIYYYLGRGPRSQTVLSAVAIRTLPVDPAISSSKAMGEV